jgi:exosome complex component RRP45
MISTNEKQFVLECLKSKSRIDDRSINDTRNIKIQILNADSCQVQIGKTKVFCCISCEIVRPAAHNPTEGFLSFNTEFSPMANSDSKDQEIIISRLLEKTFKRSRAVDTEGLCIVASEKVWQIRVDVRVLDHQGNLTDCAQLAAMGALLNFKRPDVSVSGWDVLIHPFDEKSPIPLAIHHIPICSTFAFFHGGLIHVVDPNLLEEQVQEGSMTIGMNIHKELCTLVKSGGIAIDQEKLMECIHIASLKATQLTDLLKNAVKQYNQQK